MGFINQSGLIIQYLGLRKNWRQYLTVNTFYTDFLAKLHIHYSVSTKKMLRCSNDLNQYLIILYTLCGPFR